MSREVNAASGGCSQLPQMRRRLAQWEPGSRRRSWACHALRISYKADAMTLLYPSQQAVDFQFLPEPSAHTTHANNILVGPWGNDLVELGRTSHQQSAPVQHRHLDPKQLTAYISSCTSWQGLLELMHTHVQAMNGIHLSALVTRLAKVALPSAEHSSAAERAHLDSFLQDVSALVSQRLHQLDPRALANILWAVARLGFRPSYSLLQRYLFAAYLALPSMQGQEVANLAWACASMNIRPGQDWLQRLYKHTCRVAPSLKAQETANLAWALAQLKASAGSQADTEHAQLYVIPASDVVPAQAGMLSVQSLAIPVATLAHEAVTELQHRLSQQLEWCKPNELMMALMALYRLHGFEKRTPPSSPSHPRTTAAGPASSLTQRQYSVLLQRAARWLQPQLPQLSMRDACHLVCMMVWDMQQPWAYGVWDTPTGRDTQREVVRVVETRTRTNMNSLGKQGLVRLGWALACLNAKLSPSWVDAYQHSLSGYLTQQEQTRAQTHPTAHSTNNNQKLRGTLVVGLWVMARLHRASGCNQTSEPVASYFGQATKTLDTATDVQGNVNGQGVMLALSLGMQEAMTKVVPGLTMAQLSKVIWSLGKLVHPKQQGHATNSQTTVVAPLQPQLVQALLNQIQMHITQDMGSVSQSEDAMVPLESAMESLMLQGATPVPGSTPTVAFESSSPAHSGTRTAAVKRHSMLLSGMLDLQLPTPFPLLLAIARHAAGSPPRIRLTAPCIDTSASTSCPAGSQTGPHEPLHDQQEPAIACHQHSSTALPSTPTSGATAMALIQLFYQLLRSSRLSGHSDKASAAMARVLIPATAAGAHELPTPHVYTLVRRLVADGTGKWVDRRSRAALVMRLGAGLRDMPARHVVRAMGCTAQLGVRPGHAWAGLCLGLVEGGMEQLGLQELSSALWAVAKWNLTLPRSWTAACVSAMFKLTSPSIHSGPLASDGKKKAKSMQTATQPLLGLAAVRSLWALQQLHVKAPQLKSRLMQMAFCDLSHMSPSEALWLLRVVTSSKTMLLPSQWRKLVKACMMGSGAGHSMLAAQGSNLREGARKGLPSKRRHLMLHVMSAPHLNWVWNWPTWVRARAKLKCRL